MAPAAKPPRPQPQPPPRQPPCQPPCQPPPQRASAGAEVATAAPAMVAAATRAVSIFFMTFTSSLRVLLAFKNQDLFSKTKTCCPKFPFIGECRLNDPARSQPSLACCGATIAGAIEL